MHSPVIRPARVLLVAVVGSALLLGCGGSSERFSGKREVPPGFELAEGTLASFAHPETWMTATRSVQSARVLSAQAPVKAGETIPTIQLRQIDKLEGSFDSLVRARRSFAESSGEDRSEKREDVEVPGTKRAELYRGEVSLGGTRYESFDLSILTDEGAGIFFSAVVPADGDVDAGAILDSLRLTSG